MGNERTGPGSLCLAGELGFEHISEWPQSPRSSPAQPTALLCTGTHFSLLITKINKDIDD